MKVALYAALLATLPAAVCASLALRPSFFALPEGIARGRSGAAPIQGKAAVLAVLGCLAAVPATLWLLVHSPHVAQTGTFAFSAVAALWGALALSGRRGLALASALLAAGFLLKGTIGLACADILSVLAGLGGAHLLNATFRTRTLVWFLGAFAALDVVIVGGGLVGAAVQSLPLDGAFIAFHPHADPFNRVQLGTLLLGTGDLAYAGLVAAVLVALRSPRRDVALTAGVYLLAMAVTVGLAVLSGAGAPATVPGALALLALWLGRRRRSAARAQTSSS